MRPPPARDAATVVVVRDHPDGLQLLMLRRGRSDAHNSGAWVFPGGVLDQEDRELAFDCDRTDAQASAALNLQQGGLAYYIAAIRECFEEAGILFAEGAAAGITDLPQAAQLAQARAALRAGDCSFAQLCQRHAWRLNASHLHYIGHWLTPHGRPKRFDTRFFVAVAPRGQEASCDGQETTEHRWATSAQVLGAPSAADLMTPTRAVLETVMPFQQAGDLVRWARSLRDIPCTQPRLAQGSTGVVSLAPGHPAYDEVCLLDPDQSGAAWCELRPGVPVALGHSLMRTTDRDGTHVYAVSAGEGRWTRLDAGQVTLVAADRIVVAPDRSAVPAHWLPDADWLAPARGFLQRLKP